MSKNVNHLTVDAREGKIKKITASRISVGSVASTQHSINTLGNTQVQKGVVSSAATTISPDSH